MYVKVKDLQSTIGFMLLEKGVIDEIVEIKPVKANWELLKEEIKRGGVIPEDKIEESIQRMKENSIPCHLIGKNGNEIYNTFGLGQLFFPYKTDVKENKDEIGK